MLSLFGRVHKCWSQSSAEEENTVREVNVAMALSRALAPHDRKGDLEKQEDLPELEIFGRITGHVVKQ